MNEPRGMIVTPRLLWAMLSAAAVVVGSLGPWLTIGALTVSGTTDASDGIVTLICGILAFGLVVAERARPAVAAVAGVALAVGVSDAIDVLRIEGNELFSVSVGWGLIVLNLGAASLLIWGVVEIVRGGVSRSGALLIVATVAVVATAGIVAANAPDDTDDPVAQLEGGDADETPAKKSAPVGPGTEPCDKLGINAERGREGDCLASNGELVQVADRSSSATLDDMTVSLLDIRAQVGLRDFAGEAVEPEGVFVEVTLRVANRTKEPISLSDNLFALTADGTTNAPTPAFVGRDSQLGNGGELGPGLSRTGTVLFDIAQSTADAIPRDGNVVMLQPSDEGGLRNPEKRLAILRTYGTAPRSQRRPKNTVPSSPEVKPAPEADPEPAEGADPEPAREADPPSSTKSCGDLTVSADSVTCEFAQNVFYEYWSVSDDGSNQVDRISAFSPALGKRFELSCDAGEVTFTCVTPAGGEVTIPRDALVEYTQADADAYACNNTVSTPLAERGPC